MRTDYVTFLFLLFLVTVVIGKPAAQNSYKKVTINVIDAVSGKPVEGAEVIFKALLGKQVKKTNSEGKAFFEMMLIAETLDLKYTVNCPAGARTYKPYSGSITLVSSKESFEYTATVQPNSRIVSFKISDDKKQPLSKVTVKLKDDNGKDTETKSDANGIAIYDIAPGASYKNAMLTVTKEGFNDYTIPVEINDQTTQVSVVAVLTARAPVADADMGMPTSKPDLPGPTGNVITTAMPAGFLSSVKPEITYGPYMPICSTNPLYGVPDYTPMAVEDEKSLFDHITSECFGAAGEAVNALADLTENIVSLSIKLNASWNRAFPNTGQKQAGNNPAVPDSLKLRSEDAQKAATALKESLYKTRELFEKMSKISAGPGLYAVECIFEGFRNYVVPEPLMKLKKNTEVFAKARTGIKEKMDAMQKKIDSNAPLTPDDLNLYTNWIEITENVEKCYSSLNLIYTYISDPATILPYETQVNLAISKAEKMKVTLMGDCQIRELDRQIRQGILAGQASLAAARKRRAQMLKGENNSARLLTAYVLKNFKPEDQSWQNYPDNDIRWTYLPQEEYLRWASFHNGAYYAVQDSAKIYRQLMQLRDLCSEIQPMAAALNERVKKYEDIYKKGMIALEACKLKEARECVAQLQTLENSDCGHFFPKPFLFKRSEEINLDITTALKSGKCAEAVPTGAWVLTRTELGESSNWIKRDEKSLQTKTTDENNKEVPDISYTLLTPLPTTLIPGTRIKIDLSGSCLYEKEVLFYCPSFVLMDGDRNKSYDYDNSRKAGVGIDPDDGHLITSATGSMELTIPRDAADKLIIRLRIWYGFEGDAYLWAEYFYEKK